MNVLIESPFTTLSGYGYRSYDFVNAFLEVYPQYNTILKPLEWGNSPHRILDNEKEAHLIQRIYRGQYDPKGIDMYIFIGMPNECKPKGGFNVIITAGIETHMVSPKWIIGANQMDLVLVSSNFSKNGFLIADYNEINNQTKEIVSKLNLTSKIDTLFEGYHPEKFFQTDKKNNAVEEMFKYVDTDFNFMFIGTWLPGILGQDRKDIGMLVKTFYETFKYKEGEIKKVPGLILKTGGVELNQIDKNRVKEQLNYVKNLVIQKNPDYYFPPVYLFYGDLTTEELNFFYNHPKVSAYVSFTKGEGFNRTPLEFIPTKKPIIISNHSGHLDYLNNRGSILLPGKLNSVHPSVIWKDVIEPSSKWFTVDYDYANKKLKDVFENYTRYQDKTRMQKCKDFTYDRMKERIKDLFDTYIDNTIQILD